MDWAAHVAASAASCVSWMSKRDTRPAIVSGSQHPPRRAGEPQLDARHVRRLAHFDEHGEAARAEERDGVEVEHHEIDTRRLAEVFQHERAQVGRGQHVDLTADDDHHPTAVPMHGKGDLVIARWGGGVARRLGHRGSR